MELQLKSQHTEELLHENKHPLCLNSPICSELLKNLLIERPERGKASEENPAISVKEIKF